MKKLNLALIGLAAVSLASCSSDEPAIANGDGPISITVQLPADMASRASYDTGLKATNLQYAIYECDANGANLSVVPNTTATTTTNIFTASFNGTSLSTTITPALVKGKSYQLVFWADASGNGVYTFKPEAAGATMTMDYAVAATKPNSEDLDAFYGKSTVITVGTTAANQTVTLKRPFAQVNVGTSGITAPAVKKAFPNGISTQLKASKGLGNTLDLFAGTVTNSTNSDITVTYDAALTSTTSPNVFPVSNYEYMAMDYLLPLSATTANAQAATDINIIAYNGTTSIYDNAVPAAPIRANYRTNIYGELLTATPTITVTIDPAFDGTNPVEAGAPIATAADLTKALAAGGYYVVNGNCGPIDLSGYNGNLLSLYIKSQVGTITLGNTSNVTITVAKDVPFPTIVRAIDPADNKYRPLKNLTIKGDPTSSQKCAGIDLGTGGWNEIDNVTFDGIPFNGQPLVLANYNCRIAHNVTVRNCVFTGGAYLTGGFGPYGNQTIENFLIENNTIDLTGVTDAINGIRLGSINDGLVVRNNTVTNSPYHGIFVLCKGTSVIENNVATAANDALKVQGGNDDSGNKTWNLGTITVKGNTLTPGENGIRIVGDFAGADVTINGNTIDMQNVNGPYSNGEPSAILLNNANGAATVTPVINVFGNTQVGTTDLTKFHWFEMLNLPDATGNFSNPW